MLRSSRQSHFGHLQDYGPLLASGGWKTLIGERDDRLTMQVAWPPARRKYLVLVLVRPRFSHKRSPIVRMLGKCAWAKKWSGELGMRGFRRWSSEETDIGHGIALFRTAPGEVLAERETAWAAELTPNMVVLGDPLPGRSALEAKHRTSPHWL